MTGTSNRGNPFRGAAALVTLSIYTAIVCMAIFVIALVRLITPFRGARKSLTGAMDGAVTFWVTINSWLLRVFGVTYIEMNVEGELKDRSNWWVITSNHQSWSDVVIIQVSLLRLAPTIKFFTKRELIWVPFIGLAMWLLRFPYVRRFSREAARKDRSLYDKNRLTMERAAQQFLERPVSVLTFVEGTRFSQDKQRAQKSPFKHLLVPRTGGLAFALETLESELTQIVDLTIYYEDAVPGFWEFFCGACPNVKLDVRPIELTGEWRTNLKEMVLQLWEQKDRRISEVRGVNNSGD